MGETSVRELGQGYNDIYSPLTLKYTQEFVLVKFHLHSALTSTQIITIRRRKLGEKKEVRGKEDRVTMERIMAGGINFEHSKHWSWLRLLSRCLSDIWKTLWQMARRQTVYFYLVISACFFMSVDIPALSVYVHINHFTALMRSYDVLYDVFSICR